MRVSRSRPGFPFALLAAALLGCGCGDGPETGRTDDRHEDHTEHPETRAGPDVHDEHDGPDEHGTQGEHDAGDGHDGSGEHDGSNLPDEHDGERHVELTPEQRRRIGLELATAGPGTIARELSFPGEVVLDPDRVAHVVPRADGVVRAVTKSLGDQVEEGEILAWIESAELAKAKLDLYAAEVSAARALVDLPRAREIHENVGRLLVLLKAGPSDEELDALDGLEMGAYRGMLLTAHAAHAVALKACERERALRETSISSGQDLIAAEAELQRAHAAFEASLDTARFEVFSAFGDAVRSRQVAEFEAVAAEQSLRLMGVEESVIESLRDLVPKTGGAVRCVCDEPGCEEVHFPSVRKTLGKDARLGWFPLRAPLAGVVIEKHLTLGERVGGDESVLAVADTSTVWVNLAVFQKDLHIIATGQSAEVRVAGHEEVHSGSIAYLAPVVDPETRTVRARVVLADEEKCLRPGLFVTTRVVLPPIEATVVVRRDVVQILDEEEVVFVVAGDGFEAVRVSLGQGDRERVEITDGLRPGQRYVERGAFELKAKIATGGLGAHAGHGH